MSAGYASQEELPAHRLRRHWQSLKERMDAFSIYKTADSRNLRLLVLLRWLAVGGQVVTILVVQFWMGIALPLVAMGSVIGFLVILNVFSLHRSRTQAVVNDAEVFTMLLLDVAALTAQLYLSGGATNPFVSLFLLQAILGAVLLRPLWSWTLIATTCVCFLGLTAFYRDIGLQSYQLAHAPFGVTDISVYGTFLCFLLAAVLLALFLTRIGRNMHERDERLADLRQQSIEEEHIVRMGLLASGAAHELGTPLSTLSVILNDWERRPMLYRDPELGTEIDEMLLALDRCKDIVSRILLTAGEARGEESERTTLVEFFDDVVADWREMRAPAQMDYNRRVETDIAIASDTVLQQMVFNVLDNALEASPDWIGLEVSKCESFLTATVRDKGSGFSSEILSNFGKPYQSTKKRPGSGLGLFLVVNVLRTLGGTVTAANNRDGGASITLRIPISALSIEGQEGHDSD